MRNFLRLYNDELNISQIQTQNLFWPECRMRSRARIWMLMWNTAAAAGADGGLRSLNRGLTEIDRHHIFSIYPLNPVVSQYFPPPPCWQIFAQHFDGCSLDSEDFCSFQYWDIRYGLNSIISMSRHTLVEEQLRQVTLRGRINLKQKRISTK